MTSRTRRVLVLLLIAFVVARMISIGVLPTLHSALDALDPLQSLLDRLLQR